MSKESTLEYLRRTEVQIKKRIAMISQLEEGATYRALFPHSSVICTLLEIKEEDAKVRVLATDQCDPNDFFTRKGKREKAYTDYRTLAFFEKAELWDPDQAPLIVNWEFVSREFKTKYFKGGTNE